MSATTSSNDSETKTSRRLSANKISTRNDVTPNEGTAPEVATTEAATKEAVKYAALATNYGWTRAALMILFNYIVLLSLCWSIEQFKFIKNIREPLLEKQFPLLLAISFGSLVAGVIGYGRPYSPAIISFAGVCVIAFGLRKHPGLIKCTETFFTLLSVYSIILEYFYIGYFYWSYFKKTKIFARSIITLVITSFISIYHFCRYHSSS